MKKFFYWVKINLGFSRKEAKGFLLVLPVLLLLSFLSKGIEKLNSSSDFEILNYHSQLDSLEEAGWEVASSSQPTFNPKDTATIVRYKQEGLKRIAFSEADSITLQIVSGIGPALAGRIIKYKVVLGGFHDASQLEEIYGLESETIKNIWEYFDFEPEIFRKIPLNKSEVSELSAHPYISYGQAKVLQAYREQHGDYKTAEDLLKIKIFTSDWVEKLKPYLDFSANS